MQIPRVPVSVFNKYVRWFQLRGSLRTVLKKHCLKGCWWEPNQRAHLDLFLKLLDLPFQRLHVGDEGHGIRGAGRVHRVLLQLLARLFRESTELGHRAQATAGTSCWQNPALSPLRSGNGILSCLIQASAQICWEPLYAKSHTSSSPWIVPAGERARDGQLCHAGALTLRLHFSHTEMLPQQLPQHLPARGQSAPCRNL